MPCISLPHRAVILVSGLDAETFLQNILTLDLDLLQSGDARPGALLSPQGKILFDFLISRDGEAFRIECRSDVASDFARRLTMYKLRAKVELAVEDQALVGVSWGDDSDVPGSFVDRRFGSTTVRRSYGGSVRADATLAQWTAFRVAQGVAESGEDYQLGDAFPHDVLLDQNNGVGFKKGCYIGQEVVSRMQHRSTARRRILVARAASDLPPAGTDVTVNGRSIGVTGSAAGHDGLALVRIDKAKLAMDAGSIILAGDVPISLSIPAWATFRFPDASVADGEA